MIDCYLQAKMPSISHTLHVSTGNALQTKRLPRAPVFLRILHGSWQGASWSLTVGAEQKYTMSWLDDELIGVQTGADNRAKAFNRRIGFITTATGFDVSAKPEADELYRTPYAAWRAHIGF
jgi:hypothetical protein